MNKRYIGITSRGREIVSATDAFVRGIKSLDIPVEWDGRSSLVLTGTVDETNSAVEALREFDPNVSMLLDADKSGDGRTAYYVYWEGGAPKDYSYDSKRHGYRIKSARFIVEDENGEVLGSADTYEEAETMGGARIIDGEKVQSSRSIGLSAVGDVMHDYTSGNIDEDAAFRRLEKLVGMEKAEMLIDKWRSKVMVWSRRISSSIDKAVSEAEDYFGTVASDNTVTSQDVVTYKDGLEMKDVAERNNVKVRIGKFSVTFFDDEGDFEEMVHRD